MNESTTGAQFSPLISTPLVVTGPKADSLIRLRDQLHRYGQEHVLRFWGELTTEQRQGLVEQINAIDLELMSRLVQQNEAQRDWQEVARKIQPPPAIRLSDMNEQRREEAQAAGETALQTGGVGVMIVAGGQGTRLGFDSPKGVYPIGPLSNSTLLQLFIEQALAVRVRYGAAVPLYVMTSPATHDEIVEYFKTHDYFGFPAEDLFIFCQGVLPTVDQQGRLMLADKDRLSVNPDGHGGMLSAIRKSGALADMKRRRIEHIQYLQVDNPFVEIGDPQLIGHHVLNRSEITTAAVAKKSPLDKVGNIVTIDGRLQIIEYSNIPASIAEQTAENGSLLLWAGNMALHCITVALLERTTDGTIELPVHSALRKVPYVDDCGQRVEPAEPNATKFERFIFDLLPASERSFVVEFDAWSAFCPLKNASGAEAHSPEVVRDRMLDLHRTWLRDAGAEICDSTKVEISPLWASNAAAVKEKLIPGTKILRDAYLR